MNNITKTIISLISLSAATALGWHFGKQEKHQLIVKPKQEIIAMINDEAITKDVFIQQMILHGGMRRGQYQTLEQKQNLLDYLINQEVMFSEAKKAGMTQNVAVNNLFKQKVVEQYLEKELKPKLTAVKVSNNDVILYYEKHKQSYNRPERRRAAILFVKGDNLEKITEAQNKIKEMDTSVKHFGELAKIYSDDANSRYRGGVIGWLINHPDRKYRWNEKVTNALFSLKENGDISPIIKTEKGYYLVKLVEKEKQKEQALTKLEKGIKNSLIQKSEKKIKSKFIDTLIASADITINKNMLNEIKPLSSTKINKQLKPPALPGSGGKL